MCEYRHSTGTPTGPALPIGRGPRKRARHRAFSGWRASVIIAAAHGDTQAREIEQKGAKSNYSLLTSSADHPIQDRVGSFAVTWMAPQVESRRRDVAFVLTARWPRSRIVVGPERGPWSRAISLPAFSGNDPMSQKARVLPLAPMFDDDQVRIAREDNRTFLPSLPDDSFQLIVTSPPYNIGKEYE